MGEISERLDAASGREPESDERVRGILEQVKADVAFGSTSDPRGMLQQRLEQTGIELSADRLDELVREVEGAAD